MTCNLEHSSITLSQQIKFPTLSVKLEEEGHRVNKVWVSLRWAELFSGSLLFSQLSPEIIVIS